jgi:metal-responsive CopG/Arc/MetJ family transcriptional regulator
MNKTQRVTLSLPADLLKQLRAVSDGNLSSYVARVLREYLEGERRRELREALIAGAIANAEEALELAEETRYVDYEMVMKYVPPSPELETEDAPELSTAR